MGALTRFPYLVMKNGGGAFMVPFILMMILAGAPLFYLEVILGQFSGKSPLALWEFSPAFKGIGISCTILSGILCKFTHHHPHPLPFWFTPTTLLVPAELMDRAFL